jgi:hypothetical protein
VKDDLSEGFLAARMTAFAEAETATPGERFAVVATRSDDLVVVREQRRKPGLPPLPALPLEPPFGGRLVGSVRGLLPAITAVAWVRVDADGGVEILVEDVERPSEAERIWKSDPASRRWSGEPAVGLLRCTLDHHET